MIEHTDDIDPNTLTKGAVFVRALVQQTIDHRCVEIFVIATQHKASLRIADLVRQQENDGLNALKPSIAIVT